MHGVVFSVEDDVRGRNAVKFHRNAAAYRREVAAYEVLMEKHVERILDFNVPQLLDKNDGLRVIVMTVVRRPFVLDFGGAYLDDVPEFETSVWEEWQQDKIEKFGDRWPVVQKVLSELRGYGIHMLDVNPGNISFVR